MAHILLFWKEHRGIIRFLIWVTALGCILLQLWLGGCGTLPLATADAAKPILGLPLGALNRASDTLMCDLGPVIRAAPFAPLHLPKVQVQVSWTYVLPQRGHGPACRLPPCHPPPLRGRDMLLLPLPLFARLFFMCNYCFVTTLTSDEEQENTKVAFWSCSALLFYQGINFFFICTAVYKEVSAFLWGFWI